MREGGGGRGGGRLLVLHGGIPEGLDDFTIEGCRRWCGDGGRECTAPVGWERGGCLHEEHSAGWIGRTTEQKADMGSTWS